MRTDILPYRRIGEAEGSVGKTKEKGFLQVLFSKNSTMLLPVAFLLGRAFLTGGLMPFGISVYAATMGSDINRILVAVFVVLGMVTSGAGEQIYITVAAMLLFSAFNIPFRNIRTNLSFKYAVIAFVSVLIPGMVMACLQGFLLYDMLKTLLQAFVVFLMVFIFRNVVPLVGGNRKKLAFSNEETISIAIIAALALSGLSNIQVFGFGIKNILCILVILLFSYRCGPGVGAAIGVTVGLIISMSVKVTPLVIGSYAFCGLLAGVLRSLGKMGSGLGFVLGNAVLTIYLNGSADTIIYLKEIITALTLFMVIPGKMIEIVAGSFNRDAGAFFDKKSYSSRIKELTVEKLNKFSKAFKELSKTFSEISETKVVTDKQDISVLFDRVADKICKDCSLCLHCWDMNFYNTYQILFKILEKLDSKGRIEEKEIPAYFIERCERINDFIKEVNNIYEIFKLDMVWKNRIVESRELVSQQLDGLSKVVSNLAAEIDIDVRFKSDLEDVVITELNKAGIRVDEVIVFENKWRKYEVSVFHKGCGGSRKCITVIEKIVSDVVGRKMEKESGDCRQSVERDSCILKLIEEESLRVTTGVAKIPKHGDTVSGDSYTFMSAGDGKYILALSDGMGSGQKAAIQSRATISLLEQFTESGFDRDTTIKIINSILVLKSSDDSFATIDLSVIDLYDGEVEFVKIGAAPTFIKRNDSVETVRSASLPAGILCNIETELIHKKVGNGDFIIMMTDGVVDTFSRIEGNGEMLKKFLHELESTNPQEIAESILNKACENCEGKTADDMTVIAAKIWKRAD